MQEQYDSAFLGILQHEGTIVNFLDSIFSFLYRKTDFYLLMKAKHEKLGFPPGQALKILVNAFQKFETAAKRDAERRLKKQNQVAAAATAAAATTTATTIIAASAASQSQPKDIGGGSTRSGNTVQGASCSVEHRPSTSATNETSTDNTHGNASPADDTGRSVCDGGISDVAKMSADSEQQSEAMEANKMASGLPEKHKSSSKKEEESEAELELKRQQATFQANSESYNGAMRENYRWSQSISDVDVRMQVPQHIMKGRDVRVEIRRKHLTMSYHDVTGEWVTVVDGDLTWDVNKEECMWTLVPREHVHVNLEKVQERWWEAVLATEPTINVRNIDPSRPMSDLDDEAQAKIEEMMFNDRQKKLGMPTSDQQKIQEMLTKAWDAEGSPFRGQPFDPSKINMSGNNTMDING